MSESDSGGPGSADETDWEKLLVWREVSVLMASCQMEVAQTDVEVSAPLQGALYRSI